MKSIIRQLRRERKLSQEELAAAVGTTRQTITSIEVGSTPPLCRWPIKLPTTLG